MFYGSELSKHGNAGGNSMEHEPQSTEFDIKLEVEQEGGGELVQIPACMYGSNICSGD